MIAPAIRLSTRAISKCFGGVIALSEVSLEARAGEVHAICGENGAGKSTLMNILSGVITDYEGELTLSGSPVRFHGPRDAEEQGVSIIHQELNLIPQLSAAANIFLGREQTKAGLFLDDRAMEREAAGYLEQLGSHFSPRTKIRNLRIGDQQLVEIAKALSLDADIVIMDEPTSALADAEVARLYTVIDSLKQQGVTVLYISHKMDEIFHLADRITVLRDGRLVRTLDRNDATREQVIGLMVGRAIESPDTTPRQPGAEVLRVDGLSLPRSDRPDSLCLDNVSLTLRAGEIVGIAGLLGAGRTELLECLFGLHRPSAGSIVVHGQPRVLRDPGAAMALGIALAPEDRKCLGLFEHMSVGQNITLCHLDRLSRLLFLRRGEERRLARQSVEQLGIKAAGLSAPILSLSGGNQQKCILARWLLTRPSILLLDEPTRGIDVGAKAEIHALLHELCHQGLAVLMTSSELPELLTVCDRILVLCDGRKIAEFDQAQATEERLMSAAMAFGADKTSDRKAHRT